MTFPEGTGEKNVKFFFIPLLSRQLTTKKEKVKHKTFRL